MEIFVGNLPFDITEQEVSDAFAQHGAVSKIKMLTDRETGRFRGIAFVTMDDDAQAKAAIEALNEKDLGGRPMRVSQSRGRDERPPRFSGFSGERKFGSGERRFGGGRRFGGERRFSNDRGDADSERTFNQERGENRPHGNRRSDFDRRERRFHNDRKYSDGPRRFGYGRDENFGQNRRFRPQDDRENNFGEDFSE